MTRIITDATGDPNVWPVAGIYAPPWPITNALISPRVPVISQEFRPATDESPHLGVDIMFRRLATESAAPPRGAGPFYVPLGALVVACGAGTVEAMYRHENGWRVRIDHENTMYSLYLHMAETPLVVQGQKVKTGHVLGFVGGDPSHADPSHTVHLHFEWRRQADLMAVDPTRLIESWPVLVREGAAT
jgi:murein DD-endopeptidase MepM/ murein hydrolase activator NlpD